MAIVVSTTQPADLLNAIKLAIQQQQIQTWTVDADGDFTHSPDQWKYMAWLRPKILTEQLRFTIINPKGRSITKIVYAVYHGRFVEMLLTHFDLKFSDVLTTALPKYGDKVQPTLPSTYPA